MELIEVAFSISKDMDVAGTEEVTGKEKTPKGETVCTFFLGHAVKSCMTVIESMGRYPEQKQQNYGAGPVWSALYHVGKIIKGELYGDFYRSGCCDRHPIS